mmetsp:Transcript_21793/g.49612  ORF Transcript_21793/g.49612 Transcript_21793/m.49612 type:complete len:278 (+) Transcript_21793:1457-2290(+)
MGDVRLQHACAAGRNCLSFVVAACRHCLHLSVSALQVRLRSNLRRAHHSGLSLTALCRRRASGGTVAYVFLQRQLSLARSTRSQFLKLERHPAGRAPLQTWTWGAQLPTVDREDGPTLARLSVASLCHDMSSSQPLEDEINLLGRPEAFLRLLHCDAAAFGVHHRSLESRRSGRLAVVVPTLQATADAIPGEALRALVEEHGLQPAHLACLLVHASFFWSTAFWRIAKLLAFLTQRSGCCRQNFLGLLRCLVCATLLRRCHSSSRLAAASVLLALDS